MILAEALTLKLEPAWVFGGVAYLIGLIGWAFRVELRLSSGAKKMSDMESRAAVTDAKIDRALSELQIHTIGQTSMGKDLEYLKAGQADTKAMIAQVIESIKEIRGGHKP